MLATLIIAKERRAIRADVTYNTGQVLAPPALGPVDVEVVQQNNKHDDDGDQRTGPQQPPRPPPADSALKETDGVLRKALDPLATRHGLSILVVGWGGGNSSVGRLGLARPATQ